MGNKFLALRKSEVAKVAPDRAALMGKVSQEMADMKTIREADERWLRLLFGEPYEATNGLGIVRNITFYNKDFLNAHPDIVVEKKSDSPDEDKSLADSKALIPVLKDFFRMHPLINPKTFLGDAAFDSPAYSAIFRFAFHTIAKPMFSVLALISSQKSGSFEITYWLLPVIWQTKIWCCGNRSAPRAG